MDLPPGFELVEQTKLPEGYIMVTGADREESPSMRAGRAFIESEGGRDIAAIASAMQGPTFGFLDELAGAGAAAFGAPFSDKPMAERYKSARDYIRGMTEQFGKEYPITGAITRGMTAAPTALIPIGAAPQTATMMTPAARIAQALKTGAATGAVGGLGESTAKDISSMAGDTALGATMGGVLGAGGQATGGVLGAAGGQIAQRMMPPVAADAARMRLAEALFRDVPRGSVFEQAGSLSTPATRGMARLETLGPEARIADVGGQSTTRLADVLATLPGKAKETMERAIRERQAGRPSRIVGAAEEATGLGQGFKATEEAFIAEQAAKAAPLYEQLRGMSVRVDDSLHKLIQRAPDAWKAAQDLARREGKVPLDLSKIKSGDDLSFEALDTLKKALWTIGEKEKVNFKATAESRATDSLRNELTRKLDELSPKDKNGNSIYKMARDAFAGPAEAQAALQRGREIFREDVVDLPSIIKGMSPSELEAFRVGTIQAIRDKAGTEGGQTSLLKMWKESKTSDPLRIAFGDDFRRFSAEIAKEGKLKQMESVGRGSQTASRLAAAEELGAAGDLGRGAMDVTRGNLMGAMQNFGNALSARQMPEPTRNKLAELLMKQGPAAKMELQDLDRFIQQINAQRARRAGITGAATGQATTQGAQQ